MCDRFIGKLLPITLAHGRNKEYQSFFFSCTFFVERFFVVVVGWVMYIGYSDGKRPVNPLTVFRLARRDARYSETEKSPAALFPVLLPDFFSRSWHH